MISDVHDIYGFVICCIMFLVAVLLVSLDKKSRFCWFILGGAVCMVCQWAWFLLEGVL